MLKLPSWYCWVIFMLPSSCFVVSQRLWNDQHIVTRVAKVIHSHSLEPLYLFNPLMSTHINTKQIILYLNVQKTLRISIINENKGYFLETPLVVWGRSGLLPKRHMAAFGICTESSLHCVSEVTTADLALVCLLWPCFPKKMSPMSFFSHPVFLL